MHARIIVRRARLNGGELGTKAGTLIVGVLQEEVFDGKTLLIEGDVSIVAESAAHRLDNFTGKRANDLAMATSIDPAEAPIRDPENWAALPPEDATLVGLESVIERVQNGTAANTILSADDVADIKMFLGDLVELCVPTMRRNHPDVANMIDSVSRVIIGRLDERTTKTS